MKDTLPALEARFREMVLARPPAERLAMACRMFATAKALMSAGLAQEHGRLEGQELGRLIFLRLYQEDFPKTEREKIANLLAPG